MNFALLSDKQHNRVRESNDVLQLVMYSTEEEPSANCTITVWDSQKEVTDTELLSFAVQAIPPGEVCNSYTVSQLLFSFLFLFTSLLMLRLLIFIVMLTLFVFLLLVFLFISADI